MPLCALLGRLLSRRAARAATSILSPEQMSADLDQLAEAIRTRWAYLEHREQTERLNLNALLAHARTALAAPRSPAQFAQVLREFVAALHDGHADVAIPGLDSPARRWPILVERCAEGVIALPMSFPAHPAAPSFPAELRMPRPGDLIDAVNGEPIADALSRIERRTFASAPEARGRLALMHLRCTDDPFVTLGLHPVSGPAYHTTLPTIDGPLRDGLPVRGPANFSLSWPAEKVALLHVPTFAFIQWDQWMRASIFGRPRLLRESRRLIDECFIELSRFAARGLILDLRGNDGGTDALGIHLARHLLPTPFIYMRLVAKYFGTWGEPAISRATPFPNPYTGPVVALTDELCFSTTDNLLRCLDDLRPDFTTVGRPTGAGTGAPRAIATLAHSRAAVTLCTMRVLGPTSGPIEGEGTRPDVPVTWTRDDYLKPRDPDIHAAVNYLRPNHR
jgi:hypothetical protein